MPLYSSEVPDFTFGAQFTPDKIIYRTEVTYDVPEATTISDYHEFSFPHNLPTQPLLLGSYSDDSFTTSHDYGHGPYGTLDRFMYLGYTMMAHVWSTTTHVHIRAISHNQARNITFRIIGLAGGTGGDGSVIVPAPPVQDSLLFTTDENTMKHAITGVVGCPTDGSGNFVNYDFDTYTGLRVFPMCFMFYEGKCSFSNTMSSIELSDINLDVVSWPGKLRLGVQSNIVATPSILIKGYFDA